MRKIIQLTYVSNDEDRHPGVLYALCDDGSLWWRNETGGAGSQWNKDAVPPLDVPINTTPIDLDDDDFEPEEITPETKKKIDLFNKKITEAIKKTIASEGHLLY